MKGMGLKLAQLGALRRQWAALTDLGRVAQAGAEPSPPSRLTETLAFGRDPGDLRMFGYVPDRLAPQPALVVVLHGCTQNAAGYDAGAGWSTLADRYGFALLLPEQRASNNPKTCFNWFLPGDTSRDGGEAASIRSMIDTMVAAHGLDPSRIFVTGLSAGGAMTAVMLATYPEVFAAGAVVAGLPYGGAHNVQEALNLMFRGDARPAAAWGDAVRAASPHAGPWPRLSVWHGSEDRTVVPANADEIVKQWTDLHGLAESPDVVETVSGQRREAWRDADGRVVVESIRVAGLGHGTPLDPGPGESQCGTPGPFLLEAGISSTWHIARFFGIADKVIGRRPATASRPQAADVPRQVAAPKVEAARPASAPAPARPAPRPAAAARLASPGRPTPDGAIDVAATINKALRAAGLLR